MYCFFIKNIYFIIIFYHVPYMIFLFNRTDDFIFNLLFSDYMEKNKQCYNYGEQQSYYPNMFHLELLLQG